MSMMQAFGFIRFFRQLRSKWLLALACVLFISGCSRPTTVDKIRQEGVLHVITRNAPSVYYEGRDGARGFEYELAKAFADNLGVALKVRVANNLGEIYSVLSKNHAHFAAAGLAINDERRQSYQFSPSYLTAASTVIYRAGTLKPQKIEDLEGRRLVVIADSNHITKLRELHQQHPGLIWEARADMDVVELLERMSQGEIDVAIIDSTELQINQVFFKKVRAAFPLQQEESFAWFFPPSEDHSLTDQATKFFARIEQDGTLAQLKERYYGHVDRLSYVGADTFMRDMERRLPMYSRAFEAAAKKYDLDWALLAAVGYQESNWRPDAVSPTGVKGLMMLTQATARMMGIANREDAFDSIQGGAKYLAYIQKTIPAQIVEPDRTWFTLAAYNVGYGHLEDARILTEKAGKNPNKWVDVKEFLPLLSKQKWYEQTRHGYARGYEPVIYVQNIRRYYDVLNWASAQQQPSSWLAKREAAPEQAAQTRVSLNDARLPSGLDITPPAL